MELVHSYHPKTDEVAVTTFDFSHHETSTLVVGTEEGNVYQAHRFDRANNKAGLDPSFCYKSHSAMVTRVDFHPLNNHPKNQYNSNILDFSDLFLTSSLDWTIKLWKYRKPLNTSANSSGGVRPDEEVGGGDAAPILEFDESNDYVYDVKWNPIHPAIFASANGSGNLDVYNLNKDLEVKYKLIRQTNIHLKDTHR